LASVYDKINDNEFSCLTLLDFKKAFDTVYHLILLHKLEHYSIRGVANKLLSSFLSDRQQYTAYNALQSKTSNN